MSRRRKPDNPKTAAEWQEAVDAAHFWLLVDSAEQYGLVKTDARINTDRCEEILRLGSVRGVYPRKAKP